MKHIKRFNFQHQIVYKIKPNYKFDVIMDMLEMSSENIEIFNLEYVKEEMLKYEYVYLIYEECNDWWGWMDEKPDNYIIKTITKKEIDESEIFLTIKKYNL